MKKLVVIMFSFAVLGAIAFPCAKSPTNPADLGNPILADLA